MNYLLNLEHHLDPYALPFMIGGPLLIIILFVLNRKLDKWLETKKQLKP